LAGINFGVRPGIVGPWAAADKINSLEVNWDATLCSNAIFTFEKFYILLQNFLYIWEISHSQFATLQQLLVKDQFH
jgi:hypothetical protein